MKEVNEMNEATLNFWNDYWGNQPKPTNVRAYRYGDTPDELAMMVASGKKTATSNALLLFELNNRIMPKVGDYHIILDKAFLPVALIQVQTVTIVPYDEIDEPFAIAEGDGSYENWDEIHERFFTEQLSKFKEPFHRKIDLVCQTFNVLAIHQNTKENL